MGNNKENTELYYYIFSKDFFVDITKNFFVENHNFPELIRINNFEIKYIPYFLRKRSISFVFLDLKVMIKYIKIKNIKKMLEIYKSGEETLINNEINSIIKDKK